MSVLKIEKKDTKKESAINKKASMIVHVIPITNNKKNIPSKKKVFQGARVVLSPVYSKTGALLTGHTYEEEQELSKKMGITIDRLYWLNFSVVLNDQIKVLDLSRWEDLRTYRFLLTHPYVANSKNEITNKCYYYMVNEVDEAKEENKGFQHKLDAYKYINEMSIVEKAEFLRLFGYKTYNLTNEVILNKLIKIAEESPEKIIIAYEDPYKDSKILLEELLHFGVVTKVGTIYMFNENAIGGNQILAAQYLRDPANADVVQTMVKMAEQAKEQLNR